MYYTKYSIPYNKNNIQPKQNIVSQSPQDERFLFAPFLVGGLAGTALGYGLANNNNNNCCPRPIPYPQPYPVPYYPYQQTPNNQINYYY